MQLPDLKDKKVLITGASSGIGAAAALMYGAQGAFVGVHYNQSEKKARDVLKNVKKNSDGTLLQADLRNADKSSRVAGAFAEIAGGLDILVNNAGMMPGRQDLAEAGSEYIDQIYELNLRSVFLVSRAALPFLKKSRGNIINVGSVAGQSGGLKGAGIYSSLKGALATATMAMAKEFAPYGIRVNSVFPGFIDTPFHDGVTTPEQAQQIMEMIPMKRFGTAEDVANSILFLSSAAASYITGAYIAMNGGLLMRA